MTFQLTQDMTRQYKGMQEELLGRINTLEETVQELRDNLSDADVRLERTLKEKNAIIGGEGNGGGSSTPGQPSEMSS